MSVADFYTGFVADAYGLLKGSHFDPAHYARLIRTHGEPALELGCGDGDPLLALRAEGLDVEGLDSSAGRALAAISAMAEAAGLAVDLTGDLSGAPGSLCTATLRRDPS